MRSNLTRAAVLVALLAAPAAAQMQAFGGNSPRMAATKFLWNSRTNTPAAAICIQYGQPVWKPEYDAMVAGAKNKSVRLGKDFWTTLNTSKRLVIGGTAVPPGNYYLALHADENGDLHLLVFNSRKADRAGLMPVPSEKWQPDFKCKLAHGTHEQVVEKLTITLETGDKPRDTTLKIAWGTHHATAPVKIQAGGGRKAGGEAGKRKRKGKGKKKKDADKDGEPKPTAGAAR